MENTEGRIRDKDCARTRGRLGLRVVMCDPDDCQNGAADLAPLIDMALWDAYLTNRQQAGRLAYDPIQILVGDD